MQTQLIQIGSSKGLRIPKLLIEKYELSLGIELQECKEGLIIKKRHTPREGWAEKFEALAETQDTESNSLLTMQNEFDKDEWEW